MTPAELKSQAEAVNDIIAKGRKKPLNFALVLADEGVVLEAHATKGEDSMFRAAKANGGSAKGTTGVLNVVGKIIELTCSTEDFPSSLPRVAKRHFAELGIKVRIVMMLPNGEVLNDGSTDDDADEGETGGDTASEEAAAKPDSDGAEEEDHQPGDGVTEGPLDRKTDLTNRLRASIQPVTDFNITNKDVGGRLITALKAVREALGRDDLDAADKLLSAIERTVGVGGEGAVPFAPTLKAPQQPPKPPTEEDIEEERRKLLQAFALLTDPIKVFLKRGEPSLATKAEQLAKAFATDIKGTDMKRCALLVSTLKNFLDAHTPNLPLLTEAEKARNTVPPGPGEGPESRYMQAAGLQTKYAKGSVAARDAFDGFAKVLGDQPVTPALLTAAKAEIDTVKGELAAPQKRLDQAKALPDGPKKVAAIEAAQRDIAAVQARIDAAIAFEKAARGKDGLTKALTVGPLSAKSGQKLPDETAAALIAAFARDPEFATSAINTAASATHPEVLAKGLPILLDLKDGGFAAKGQSFDPAKADKYAKDLLSMGGNVGQDFFDRMPDYMAKGRQFRVDPMNEGTKAGAELAQHRSVALAERLVGSDGKVNPGSKQLNERVDHMLFNPKSLESPTPAMNEYALKNIKLFEDPEMAKKANKILGDLPDTAKPASGTLVNRALGKAPTAPVNKRDMQTSVMASMLKSLDQGPVGSCFSTAPARRMRETEPMRAMEAYAQIASRGKYKPPFGAEMPVVISIHPGEDPIMRSWEYTLATSAAKEKTSKERQALESVMESGSDNLSNWIGEKLKKKADDEGGLTGFAMKAKVVLTQSSRTKELKKLFSDSFDFVYDPVGATGPSTDGSSTDGRYILTNKATGVEVRTKQEFASQLTAVALRAFDIEPGSPEETEIRDGIADADFLKSFEIKENDGGVEKLVYAPWSLIPGGFDEPVTRALQGKSKKEETLLAKGTGTDPEGTRTKAVMTEMLGKFLDMPKGMLPLSTSGQHAFNGLPEDPSLAPLLKGGKTKLAENLQRELVDKGQTIAATALEVERAQYTFDQMVKQLPGPNDDPANLALLTTGATNHRPTGPMTPAQIEDAFMQAAENYLNTESARYSDPAGAASFLKNAGKGKAKTALLKETGAPEFVIADTNWGDSGDHTYFVLAPDPKTGEPMMWKKAVPPGTLVPAGRDWIDREWGFVK